MQSSSMLLKNPSFNPKQAKRTRYFGSEPQKQNQECVYNVERSTAIIYEKDRSNI